MSACRPREGGCNAHHGEHWLAISSVPSRPRSKPRCVSTRASDIPIAFVMGLSKHGSRLVSCLPRSLWSSSALQPRQGATHRRCERAKVRRWQTAAPNAIAGIRPGYRTAAGQRRASYRASHSRVPGNVSGRDWRDIRIEPILRPSAPNLRRVTEPASLPLSNDTSFGVGYAPHSSLERAVLSAADLLRSSAFRGRLRRQGSITK